VQDAPRVIQALHLVTRSGEGIGNPLVSHEQWCTPSQRPTHLAQHADRITHVVEGLKQHGQVITALCHRHGGICGLEPDAVCYPGLCGVAPSLVNRRAVEVDAGRGHLRVSAGQ
jgi:hypothetical protein